MEINLSTYELHILVEALEQYVDNYNYSADINDDAVDELLEMFSEYKADHPHDFKNEEKI